MVDLLPCPFCGSSNLLTEDGDKFVMCADTSCAGHDSWHRMTHWQNRKKPDADQLKIAYAQFEASLKAAKEEALGTLEREILDQIIIINKTKWDTMTIEQFPREWQVLVTLVRELEEK